MTGIVICNLCGMTFRNGGPPGRWAAEMERSRCGEPDGLETAHAR